MSVNAFYDAYGATQNALGDPRGDARKREQENIKNAMLQREMDMKQREMQMKEYEFGQTQAEALRAERERQLLATRGTSRAGFIRDAMFPNRTPAQGNSVLPSVLGQLSEQAPQGQAAPVMPMTGIAPMTGGAPLNQPTQGETFIDPATGQEGASYTATAMSRGAMPTEDEILDFEIEDAAARGDDTFLNDRINLRRQRMTEEEKRGRQQIALISGALINLPDDQLPGAVLQTLQDLNIDLSTTKLDDYVNDPPKLRRALRVQIALGDPDEATKEAVRVTGTYEQYRPPEIKDTGDAFRAIGVMPGNAGTTIGAPVRINVSPNTSAQVGATIRGQNVGAATARRGQNISVQNTNSRNQATIKSAILTGKIQLGDEVSPDEFAD
jgi:hypothetical protein